MLKATERDLATLHSRCRKLFMYRLPKASLLIGHLYLNSPSIHAEPGWVTYTTQPPLCWFRAERVHVVRDASPCHIRSKTGYSRAQRIMYIIGFEQDDSRFLKAVISSFNSLFSFHFSVSLFPLCGVSFSFFLFGNSFRGASGIIWIRSSGFVSLDYLDS